MKTPAHWHLAINSTFRTSPRIAAACEWIAGESESIFGLKTPVPFETIVSLVMEAQCLSKVEAVQAMFYLTGNDPHILNFVFMTEFESEEFLLGPEEISTIQKSGFWMHPKSGDLVDRTERDIVIFIELARTASLENQAESE